jgi:hypothetical protein
LKASGRFSAPIVSGPSPDDLQDDQRPAGDPRLRPHPASIPGVFPDYFARSSATCQTARARWRRQKTRFGSSAHCQATPEYPIESYAEHQKKGDLVALNFLEQLVAEWYEFRGYFVRRKINVGPSLKGKFEFELDIVAFHPGKPHLVHIESSMDATSWDQREKRYTAKFGAGRKHIPSLFSGFDLPEIDQIALLVFAGKLRVPTLGGGKVLLIQDFMNEIRSDAEWGLATRSVRNRSVPEQYVILRSLQFATNYWITA